MHTRANAFLSRYIRSDKCPTRNRLVERNYRFSNKKAAPVVHRGPPFIEKLVARVGFEPTTFGL